MRWNIKLERTELFDIQGKIQHLIVHTFPIVIFKRIFLLLSMVLPLLYAINVSAFTRDKCEDKFIKDANSFFIVADVINVCDDSNIKYDVGQLRLDVESLLYGNWRKALNTDNDFVAEYIPIVDVAVRIENKNVDGKEGCEYNISMSFSRNYSANNVYMNTVVIEGFVEKLDTGGIGDIIKHNIAKIIGNYMCINALNSGNNIFHK